MGVKPLAFPEKWTVADPVSFAKLPDRGDHSRRKRSNSTKPHQFRQLQPTAAAARSGASRSAAPPKKIPGYTLCPIAGHRHRVFRICWCGGKTHQLVLGIYTLTTAFPKAETYGLSLQIRRSDVSIPATHPPDRCCPAPCHLWRRSLARPWSDD